MHKFATTFLDMSGQEGIYEVHHRIQLTGNSNIWMLQINYGGELLLYLDQEKDVGTGTIVFRRLGIILEYESQEARHWLGELRMENVTIV
jgi:hypothetical protein